LLAPEQVHVGHSYCFNSVAAYATEIPTIIRKRLMNIFLISDLNLLSIRGKKKLKYWNCLNLGTDFFFCSNDYRDLQIQLRARETQINYKYIRSFYFMNRFILFTLLTRSIDPKDSAVNLLGFPDSIV
jgi:hypothetical protein